MKLKNKIISIISKVFNLGPKKIYSEIKPYNGLTLLTKKFQIDLLDKPQIISIDENFDLHYNKEKILNFCSDIYLVKAKNCRYFSINGLDVLAKKNIVYKFLTIVKGYTIYDGDNFSNNVLSHYKYPNAKRVKGKSLFLTSMGAGHVYGEWVIFLLPKIGFMQEFGYKFEDFDNIVINSPDKNWQRDFINLVGIPAEKILPTNQNSSYIFDDLTIPFGPGHSMFGFKYLKSIIDIKYIKNKKRYFFSRDRDSHMRVKNQNDLNIVFEKFKIETIFIQDYTIEEQIKIFKESELIISPQGSGLSNIVFSDSSTKFIELYAESDVNQTFQVYGYYNKNIYGFLLCKDIPISYNHHKYDLIVDPYLLEKIINSILNIKI